jgi:drug/metabolite transporter (DMT)-like permease
MTAFASNSLLCRAALRGGQIDPASFTTLRLLAGASVLSVLAWGRAEGRWFLSIPNALALFCYAAAFSMAYLRLNAGVGALVLFGMVQITMMGISRLGGQRVRPRQALGAGLALSGLAALTLPWGMALTRPPLGALGMMAAAGVAWGVYSMRGRNAGDPVVSTARNFVLTLPLAAVWWWTRHGAMHVTFKGALLAFASGGLASAGGYVIWYAALRELSALEAALVQLSVPVITAVAGVALMGEALTWRLLGAGALIVSGIAIAVTRR